MCLCPTGNVPYFASVWMDWYRSNASAPHAIDKIDGDRVLLNGGVYYRPKTDGSRNDLFERFFVTFSPMFEETLATIANPPAPRGVEAATRLWQESWGPSDYQKRTRAVAETARLRHRNADPMQSRNRLARWWREFHVP